jgi:hypothetical protein
MALVRFIPAGDVAFVDSATGPRVKVTGTMAEYVRVKLAQRFRWFAGEWFRDTRKGVPYFQQILGRTGSVANLNTVRAIFRQVLLSVPEIASIDAFDVEFLKGTRRVTFDFRVSLVDETTLVVQPTDDDFIIEV